jgi:WD40 repeat protein
LIGLVTLLVVALLFGAVAVRSRTQAEEATLAADAKRLAANALNVGASDLALLTAEEAVKEEKSPETYGALLTLLGREPDVITRIRTPHRFLLLQPSADGRTVYLGENGGDLWAVDAQTGAVRWHVPSPATDMLITMSVSPDGSTLLLSYATDASTVVAVDATTGAVTWRLDPATALAEALPAGADTWVGAAAWYSTTDIAVATATHLCFVRAATAKVQRCLALPSPFDTAGTDYETFLVWPDGRISYATAADRSQSVVIHPDRWDRPVRVDGTVLSVSADGRRAARISTSAGAHQLQILDGQSLQPISSSWALVDSQGVWTAAWSPDGSTLLVTEDQKLLVRDGATGGPRQELLGHSGLLRGTAVAGPAHDIAWSDGLDGTAVAFDLTGRRGIIRTAHGTAPGRGGATAAMSPLAVTASSQGATPSAHIVDTSSGRDLGSLDMTPFAASQHCSCQLSGLGITPDGRQALGTVYRWPTDAQGKSSGEVFAWDLATRSIVKRVPLPWGGLAVVVTPDGRRALINGVGGYAFLDLTTWTLSDTSPQPDGNFLGGVAPNVAISPDGRYAAVGRNERIVLVDLQTNSATGEASVTSDIAALAFTPDTSTVVIGSFDGHLDFLSTARLEPVAARRQVSAGIVISLAVSADGKLLASMGGDGDLMLWDTVSWRPYGDRVINHDGFGLVYITPDSTTLRAFFNGVMKEVDIRPEMWVQAGCRAANRELTLEESAVIRPDQPPRPTCPAGR